jgi:hypothetical protein
MYTQLEKATFTVVYYGGSGTVKKPNLRHDSLNKDYGYGFYCTFTKELAENRSKQFENPTVNAYEFLDTEDLTIQILEKDTAEWKAFLSQTYTYPNHPNDITIGPMLNNPDAYWISFNSYKALNRLRYLTTYEVDC